MQNITLTPGLVRATRSVFVVFCSFVCSVQDELVSGKQLAVLFIGFMVVLMCSYRSIFCLLQKQFPVFPLICFLLLRKKKSSQKSVIFLVITVGIFTELVLIKLDGKRMDTYIKVHSFTVRVKLMSCCFSNKCLGCAS